MHEGEGTHCALGEVAETNPETLPGSTPRDFRFGYIDLSAVEAGRINWRAVNETTFGSAPSRARRMVRAFDVLFGTVRPNLKSHGLIAPGQSGALVASTGFSVVRAREDLSHPSYLFHALMSTDVTAQAVRHAIGSSYPALSDSDVKRLLIFLPTYKEQQKVAQILDTLDTAIQETKAIIAKLKAVKQGLLHDLLTRGIDTNGELRPPRAQAPYLYQASPLGWLPKEWTMMRVRDAGTVKLGRQRSPIQERGAHMRPYLRVANVFDGWIDYSDVLEMNFSPAEQDTFSVLPGDILLNEGQSLELVGRCALYDGPPDSFCFQNTLVRFRSYASTVPSFARQVFKYWLDTGWFARVAKQTTSVAHLGADRFAEMTFPAPGRDEQLFIAGRVEAVLDRIEAESQDLNKLMQLKCGAMDDLLTGSVRVTTLLATQEQGST